MKKVGFTIEFGKTEDGKERGENFVSGIEALARMTEKRLSDAVNDAGDVINDAVDGTEDAVDDATGNGDYKNDKKDNNNSVTSGKDATASPTVK